MTRYQRYLMWSRSAQGLWFSALLFLVLALIDLAEGTQWLAALLGVIGLVMARRAFRAGSG